MSRGMEGRMWRTDGDGASSVDKNGFVPFWQLSAIRLERRPNVVTSEQS